MEEQATGGMATQMQLRNTFMKSARKYKYLRSILKQHVQLNHEVKTIEARHVKIILPLSVLVTEIGTVSEKRACMSWRTRKDSRL